MRKESTYRWLYALAGLAGLALVSAWLYVFQVRPLNTPVPPGSAAPAAGAGEGAEQSDDTPGLDRILTCVTEDGTTFYTNAVSCEAADRTNQLSVVDAYVPAGERGPRREECLSMSYTRLEDARPLFLARCQAPFLDALKLERRLLDTEQPAASPLAAEYCALIAQGVTNGCPAHSRQFCLLRVCQTLLEKN